MSQKKAKQKRQQEKLNGVTPIKKFSMSADMKAKFDLREKTIEQWQLISNVMDAMMKSAQEDPKVAEQYKIGIEAVQGIAKTVLIGVNKDLDFWFDKELDANGFGKASGYIPVGIDRTNGMVTVAKAPEPPMGMDAKLMGTLNDAVEKHEQKGGEENNGQPGSNQTENPASQDGGAQE